MYSIRQIVVMFALALASSGSLPQYVHEYVCHQQGTDQAHAQFEAVGPCCSCAAKCSSPASSEAAADASVLDAVAVTDITEAAAIHSGVGASQEDCSVCFQLSQETHVESMVAEEHSELLFYVLLIDGTECIQDALLNPYPPRGPPVA